MVYKDIIESEYFEWLYSIVYEPDNDISYRKLLYRLDNIPFRYSIKFDCNRKIDGLKLRTVFENANPDFRDASYYLNKPCSVFEMMVALSIRCEDTIMQDPKYGNRTRQWFWGMIKNLGLASMDDDRINYEIVDTTINRLLDREYEPDGTGGLFTVKNSNRDLRKVEIWYQLCWYIDNKYL